jgi:hypothetical protein
MTLAVDRKHIKRAKPEINQRFFSLNLFLTIYIPLFITWLNVCLTLEPSRGMEIPFEKGLVPGKEVGKKFLIGLSPGN